jgi:hypothetical protein
VSTRVQPDESPPPLFLLPRIGCSSRVRAPQGTRLAYFLANPPAPVSASGEKKTWGATPPASRLPPLCRGNSTRRGLATSQAPAGGTSSAPAGMPLSLPISISLHNTEYLHGPIGPSFSSIARVDFDLTDQLTELVWYNSVPSDVYSTCTVLTIGTNAEIIPSSEAVKKLSGALKCLFLFLAKKHFHKRLLNIFMFT